MAELVVAAAGSAIGATTITGTVMGMTGAQIGWMAGSIIGSMLFAEKQHGPKIADGKFTSNTYGQAIPRNYGTMRHAAQIIWWSGLIKRTVEVGGKGGGGAETEKARMNLLLSVCEGEQAAVLRIWASGRLIATWRPSGFWIDKEVLPTGDIRVYLGTETQLPDPTYEAAVGAENAPAYRGEVIIAIDGLEGEMFANRPPNIEVEVAQEIEAATCPLEPFAAVDTQQAGLFTGTNNTFSQGSNAAAYDAERGLYYVVTDGDGSAAQIEAYDVTGAAPVFTEAIPLALWRNNLGTLNIGGLGFDPENGLLRIAAGHLLDADYASRPIEYIYDGSSLASSPALFSFSGWGSFPVNGEVGGNGAYYGAIYAIYPDSGDVLLGEAGWWSHTAAAINYRLPRLMSGSQGSSSYRGWHKEDLGVREHEMADVLYIPKTDGVWSGINFAWKWQQWQGFVDDDGTITGVLGADGSDTTNNSTYLIYAPSRKMVYAVTKDGGIASINIDITGGDPEQLATALTAYPTAILTALTTVDWAVWNDAADALVLGHRGASAHTMLLVDPETMDILVGPCSYDGAGEFLYAPNDLGDGRFVCILGDQIAIVDAPGGTATCQAVTLRSIVEDICDVAGLPSANLDATAGTDLVAGFKIASQMTARAAIEGLRPAYFFDIPEIGEQLVLVKRGAAAVVTIDAGELGARMFQLTASEPAPPYELEHRNEAETPRRLELKYIDASANYDPGVQAAERQTGAGTAPMTLDIPVSLTADQASRIAWANLLHAIASRNPIKFALSHHYDALVPTDAVNVPHASGQSIRVRIENITRARPLLEIEGVPEEASIYSQVMGGTPRYQEPKQDALLEVADTLLVLLDLPPLRDEDDALAWYAAAAGNTRTRSWPGATVYKSSDGGTNYDAEQTMSAAATIGATTTALPDWSGGNRWDDASTVDVALSSGTFSSATDLGVLNGANAVAIGGEIVQFVTATLVGENTWRLSRLLRGRKGTERHIATHAVGDRVVLLTGSLRAIFATIGEVGAARLWKGVTSGKALADVTARTHTLAGNSIKPLSPVSIAGSRAGDDLTITWIRRARINAEWVDDIDVPLDEPSESYEIDILNAGTVVRTLTASTQTVAYTGAQQTTDFGSPQSAIDVAIYQISSRIGRGHAGAGTV